MIVADGFLDDFDGVRAYCDRLFYQPQRNVTDGVTYPGINAIIPFELQSEVAYKLTRLLNMPVTRMFVFFRLSLEGVTPPHQAHNDAIMGDWTMILHLTREQHCRGGTAMVAHRELGMEDGPRNKDEQAAWQRDTNNPDAWEVLTEAAMQPNRAMVFPARRMHRAEPLGGFGDSPENGRLVMCAFFDVRYGRRGA